jgi:hypothetical protein
LCWLLCAAGCTADASQEKSDRTGEGGDAPERPATPCDAADDECDEGYAAPRPGPAGPGGGGHTDSGGADGEGGEPGSIATVPGDVLDLTNWNLTLPIGDPGDPVKIEQPELDTYTLDPYFRLEGDRAAFLANAGGVTTSGSHFPRSELREMTEGGTEEAEWSTTSGVHTMTVTQAVTHLPDVVPHLVAGQLHGGSAYVMLVRLDDTRLWLKSDGEDVGELDPDYVLGEEYTLRIHVEDGWIDVYYNDLSTPAASLPYDKSGCYFKAGAYSQSNTDYGDAPDAYAEVQIRKLEVTHE